MNENVSERNYCIVCVWAGRQGSRQRGRDEGRASHQTVLISPANQPQTLPHNPTTRVSCHALHSCPVLRPLLQGTDTSTIVAGWVGWFSCLCGVVWSGLFCLVSCLQFLFCWTKCTSSMCVVPNLFSFRICPF